MLKWALIFLVVALIAGALGFTGVAGAAMGIAKILFFVFLVVFAVFLVLGLMAALLVMGISRGAEVIVATTSVLRGRREAVPSPHHRQCSSTWESISWRSDG